MRDLIWVVLEFGIGLIEMIIYLSFLAPRLYNVKKTSGIKKIGISIVASVIMYYMGDLQIPFIIGLMLKMGIIFATGHVIFQSSLQDEILYTLFFLVIVYLIDFLVIAIMGGNKYTVTSKDNSELSALYVQLGLISKFILFVFTKIFFKVDSKKRICFTPQVNILMYTSFAIALVSAYALSSVFFNLIGKGTFIINLCITIAALGIFCDNTIIYFVVQKLSEWLEKEKEYEVVQYQNEVLIKETLEKDEMNKEVRKIWHDFNNHMSCIDMLLQMENIEKAREYIKNMNASCQTTYMGIRTGNEMADVVVNQKFMLAKAEAIELIVKGELQEEIRINQMDLCALLCNSLDNAIEACRQIEDKEERKASLFLKMYKDYLLIDVTNSVKEEVDKNKKLVTTKSDKKRHGIGMLSMRTVVEKYGGNLEWKCENKQFFLSIIVKNITM